MNDKSDKMNNEKKATPNTRPKIMITRKDLVYVILILVFIIINSFVGENTDNKDLIAYIGFSGTITSILLGVIAIIYSFFQSYENSSSKDSLSEQLKRLHNVVDNLEIGVDSIVEVADTIHEIKKEIDHLKESMNSFQNSLDSIENSLELKENSWTNTTSKSNQLEYNYKSSGGENERWTFKYNAYYNKRY